MKLVVDMCLPPALVDVLCMAGHDAVHWSQVGDVRALDASIMHWAREQDCWIVTHDLDFGDLLFASKDHAPSVIIIREQDVQVDRIAAPLLRVLEQFYQELQAGALIAMTTHMARVRRLPLG
jgi:predicted nuclease of predicted toxin-antitoxin system